MMSEYDKQRDIDAEGQRAAIYHNKPRAEARGKSTEFCIRVDDGVVQLFQASTGVYKIAVLEALGKLGMPYPCTVEIWIPRLVDAGYGPYFYRIDDFVDIHENEYGCPAVMTATRRAR